MVYGVPSAITLGIAETLVWSVGSWDIPCLVRLLKMIVHGNKKMHAMKIEYYVHMGFITSEG